MSEINFPQSIGNQTPHAERHTNLVTPPRETPCWLDHDFERTLDDICHHVSENEACTSLVYYINYLSFFMCYMDPEDTIFGQIVTGAIICFLCLLFILSLYYVANYFAAPNAIMLAEYFQLSGHHYGTAVLAILNSIPKLFSLLLICNNGTTNVSLILSIVFGKIAGFFALGIAIIGFRSPIQLARKYFFIDAAMLSFGYTYFVSIVYSKHMHDMFATPEGLSQFGNIYLAPHAIAMFFVYCIYIIAMFTKVLKKAIKQWKAIETVERRSRFQPTSESAGLRTHFTRFLQAIDPYEHMKDISRWFFYPTVPFWCFMRVTLCVVDLKKPLHSWCKPLSIINILVSPLLLIHLEMRYISYSILGSSVAVAALMTIMTDLNKPPIFHWLFAVHGLMFSFILYNIISWEFQSLIFQVTEYFFDWNEDIIGLLCLSIFFIASELILCWKFIDDGKIDVAYGFITGLTILTLYTVLPQLVFSLCIPADFKVCITANTFTAHIFISIMLVIGLIAILMAGYEIRASISAFLLIMFCLLFYYILLSSSQTIHPYGTKHHSHYYTDIFHSTWA